MLATSSETPLQRPKKRRKEKDAGLLAEIAQLAGGDSSMTKADDNIAPMVPIEQVLLVPHTELARQFEYWARLLLSDTPTQERDLSESAVLPRIMYRGVTTSSRSISTSTFLITTPTALLDNLTRLDFSRLHTVALDEADEMLNLPGRFKTERELRKWERHPPLVISLVEELLRSDKAGKEVPRTEEKQKDEKRIIAISATANSVFRDWMVRRSGWIGQKGILGERRVDWYDFTTGTDGLATQEMEEESVFEKRGKRLLPPVKVEHLFYRVDGQGALIERTQTDTSGSAGVATDKRTEDPERYMLAVAMLFATERVTHGLVLIPSTTSTTKTIELFRSLGVPAAPVRPTIPSDSAEAVEPLSDDEPRLHVLSINAVRGIDIPSLSHVFILPGLIKDTKDYLHVAGRVGRLSEGAGGTERQMGKVISLIGTGPDGEREERRVRSAWELLGIQGKEGTTSAAEEPIVNRS